MSSVPSGIDDGTSSETKEKKPHKEKKEKKRKDGTSSESKEKKPHKEKKEKKRKDGTSSESKEKKPHKEKKEKKRKDGTSSESKEKKPHKEKKEKKRKDGTSSESKEKKPHKEKKEKKRKDGTSSESETKEKKPHKEKKRKDGTSSETKDKKPHKENKEKKRKEMSSEKDNKKRHKEKKPKYSPTMWGSSSSESEYECLFHPNQLAVARLPRYADYDDVYEFFNGEPVDIKVADLKTPQGEFIDRQAEVHFASRSATKEGLKLNGKLMRGEAIYVTQNGNSREIICVYGFNNHSAVDDIKEELGQKFRQRGKLLNVFLPVDNSGSSLGFAYIYIDLEEKTYKDLIIDTTIGGFPVKIRGATPKLCYRDEMEGKRPRVLTKGSDEEKKIALKKMPLPIPANLHNSVENQKRFSWRKDNPLFIPKTRKQRESECWAIGLHRGHSASCKQAGIDGPVPTVKEIVEGVDAAYQVSGQGIRRLKHASSFMLNYCKEMIVHRRPRGNDVALFEDFERFLIDVSSEVPVMVTVEVVPGFDNFDGKGIYRPSDIDCHLRTFEKFPVHCLFLTGNNIENGIEFWQLQETLGKKFGDEGFIKIERHKCFIKSVVVFKH